MINLTKTAVEKFNEIRKKAKNPENTMLRVYFAGYGWGGPRLELTLEELKGDNDIVIEAEDINVVYASEIEAYVDGIVIDYSNNWFNRGFTIRGGSTSSC